MPVNQQQIYIVDDDISVCRALKILLNAYKYVVEIFTSADEFFNTVSDQAPGCLILDIHMPGMDGWEAQKRLFESGSKRPVIVITADKNGGLKERALNAGAIGFLQKPFPSQEIIDLIHLAFAPGR